MPQIDSHHHLWKYSRQEYAWIADGMDVIRRDFLPDDLAAVLKQEGIDGAVAVQARQSLEETRWLLELAAQNEVMRGVVGWVPLTDSSVRATIEEFTSQPKLKGVRHILQDEPDELYMLRDDFNRGVTLLKDFGLAYDILIFERHLPQTIEFVDRHPNQVFVVDHVAKPRIRERVMSPWAERVRELARRENVYVKLSGMVTEADWANWTEDALRPYAEMVLEAFGAKRVMFGSDWPVSLLATSYERWLTTVRQWIAGLSPYEQARIMGVTATEAYRLS